MPEPSYPRQPVTESEAPAPLSSFERRLLWVNAVLCALTRWFAMSASLWDWDEVLFSSAMLDYDVPSHRPHPPGFPLFILTAKFARWFIADDFHALQSVNFLAAIVLLPALFLLCRELRFPYHVSLLAANLCVFFPNVWFFGGTAFSDVPSLTLAVLACYLLLRGRRDGWAYLAGAIVLGLAAGYRSQNLLLGAAPALVATVVQIRRRKWLLVAVGGVLGAAILFGSYWGAARASSSPENFRQAIEHHRQYILKVDSFLSPARPSLLRLFDDFFVRPFRAGVINYVLFVLNLVSLAHFLLKRYRPVLWALVIFVPFGIMAWLVLDIMSISRFSLGYIPLLAILSADGLTLICTFLAKRRGVRQERIFAMAGGVIVLTLILWSVPALWTARSTDSPPAASLRWIRSHVKPAEARVYVASGMLPYAQYALADYPITEVLDDRAVPLQTIEGQKAYLLIEGASENPAAVRFLRPRRRLWKVVRHRYFEVSVIPMHRAARFREGWYESENTGAEAWRWMGRRSLTELPPVSGPARLQMDVQFPLDTLLTIPVVTISLNGVVLDRFAASKYQLKREYGISGNVNRINQLIIETTEAVNPLQRGLADDPRDLGLLLRSISWGPALRGPGDG